MSSTQGASLGREAENWPSPTANRATRANGQRGENLNEASEKWLTPTANEDAAGTLKGKMQKMLTHQARQFGSDAQAENLNEATQSWGTPRASDKAGAGAPGSKSYQHDFGRSYLGAQAEHFRQAAPASTNGLPTWITAPTSRLLLNPDFDEALMGWPDRWLDFHALLDSESSATE